MGVNSRAKGQRFELKLCRVLSAWWTGNDDCLRCRADDLPFFRTSGSGGWATRRKRQDDNVAVKSQSGDLVTPESFPFALELKHQEGWNWDPFFKRSDDWIVFKWWKQCVVAALAKERLPLLVFHRNNTPDWIMMPYVAFRMLQITDYIRYRKIGIGVSSEITTLSRSFVVQMLKLVVRDKPSVAALIDDVFLPR